MAAIQTHPGLTQTLLVRLPFKVCLTSDQHQKALLDLTLEPPSTLLAVADAARSSPHWSSLPPDLAPLLRQEESHLVHFLSRRTELNSLRDLSRLAGAVDPQRFQEDSAYRRQQIAAQAATFVAEELKRALDLAEKYSVPRHEVLLAHLEWALLRSHQQVAGGGGKQHQRSDHPRFILLSPHFTFSRPSHSKLLTDTMSQLEMSLAPYEKELLTQSAPFLQRAKSLLSEIGGAHYEPLHFLYLLLRKSYSGPATSPGPARIPPTSLLSSPSGVQRLEHLLLILTKLQRLPSAQRVDFKLLVSSPSNARTLLAEAVAPNSLPILAKTLPPLIALFKHDQKPESELLDLTVSSLVLVVLQRLLLGATDMNIVRISPLPPTLTLSRISVPPWFEAELGLSGTVSSTPPLPSSIVLKKVMLSPWQPALLSSNQPILFQSLSGSDSFQL